MVCGNVFPSEYRLKRHQSDRHGPRIQCEYCPYSVSTQRAGDMKRHAEQHRQIVEDSERAAVTFPKMKRVEDKSVPKKRKAGRNWQGKVKKDKPAAAGRPETPEPLQSMPQFVAEEYEPATLVGIERLPVYHPTPISMSPSPAAETVTSAPATITAPPVVRSVVQVVNAQEKPAGGSTKTATEPSSSLLQVPLPELPPWERSESPFEEASHPGSLIGGGDTSGDEEAAEDMTGPAPTAPVETPPAASMATSSQSMESVRPAAPSSVSLTIEGPASPSYEPGLIPVEGPANAQHLDPRIFFLGAPSQYQDQFPSRLVRAVRHEVQNGNLVPTLVWQPEGVTSIRRTERVETGTRDLTTIYELSSVWTFDPTYGVRRSRTSQTDPVREVQTEPSASEPASRPEMRDAECQVQLSLW